jgi:hypothetical protein
MTESAPTPAGEFRETFEVLKNNRNIEPSEREKQYQILVQRLKESQAELERVQQLQGVREKLGMPPPAARELEDLHSLIQEIETALGKEGASESIEHDRNIKQAAQDLRETVTQEINYRLGERMDPFMDKNIFNRFTAGLTGLADLAESRDALNIEDLSTALTQINSGLEGMGRYPQGNGVVEDDESLAKIIYTLQRVYDATISMENNFRQGDEQAAAGAQRLRQNVENVANFIHRLRAALRNLR